LKLPSDAKGITVDSGIAPLAPNIIKASYYKLLNTSTNTKHLKIVYSSTELLANNQFLTEIELPFSAERTVVRAILTGVTLKSPLQANKRSVFPEPDKVTTNGVNIILEWYPSLSQNESMTLLLLFKPRPNQYLLLIIPAFGILLVAILVVKLKKQEPAYLLDEEKQILKILEKNKREGVWQSQLVKLTGFSKPKVTRLLRNLEQRNLIVKIPIGNTNKVKLR